MGIWGMIAAGLGLSMDAVTVAAANAVSVGKSKAHKISGALTCALIFGLFQGVMPATGYAVGMSFAKTVERYDHWIALVLLALIGIKMLKDDNNQDIACEKKLSVGMLLVQGMATSIDALAVGISFAALRIDIVKSCAVIGIITLIMTAVGFMAGEKLGGRLGGKTSKVGGIVLILLGLKIFFEHMLFS